MKKFFIPVIFAALLMGACVEKSNLVVLDKFVPITPQNNCSVMPGGDIYYHKGYIDLAFTRRYILPYEVVNYMNSSQVDGSGAPDAPISSINTNRFMVKYVEIEYEWDPRPQADGSRLQLRDALWGGTRRIEVNEAIVVDSDGGQATGMVDIFTEAQAIDLLENVSGFDWIASPLIIKLRVLGKLTDGTKIKTNTLTFNLIPSFGDTIQMGSVYRIPPGGFADDKEHWEQIRSMCAFNNPILGGCFSGQDYSMVNCYADMSNMPGNNEWQKYIATSRCHLGKDTDCYDPAYHVASVVEVVFNGFRKSADEVANGTYYACCPSELPPEPEEEEEL